MAPRKHARSRLFSGDALRRSARPRCPKPHCRVAVFGADPAAEALALFREYESRGSQFDPTLADLYSDDALIKTKRVHADGRTQELTFWGDKWKALIRQAMPLAKERKDRNSFSKISAKADGNNVVITTERFSYLKRYRSPLVLVVRKHGDKWHIIEERSETRP